MSTKNLTIMAKQPSILSHLGTFLFTASAALHTDQDYEGLRRRHRLQAEDAQRGRLEPGKVSFFQTTFAYVNWFPYIMLLS